jgi:anti-anti-sigma factor
LFTYQMTQLESTTVVAFIGDLDIEATEVIENEVTAEVLEFTNIELDFTEVPFVDSSGIGLLITLISRVRERGIVVQVTNLNQDVQMVFSLLQLSDILGGSVFADFN